MDTMSGKTNGSSSALEEQKTLLFSREYAASCDKQDALRHLREEFIIPTRADLKRKTLPKPPTEDDITEPCTYLCGNSLGLQPRSVSDYISSQLSLWATKGVYGHFKEVGESIVPPWLHADDVVKPQMAKIVGASPSEVAVMQTLTANLHLLMGSFYRPTQSRYKIILEEKAFPSDHFAVESQIRHHNLLPSEAMVLIKPPSKSTPLIPTSHILSVIDAHASTTALLLLPGIQFYTGQYLDIQNITEYAQAKGIVVGWDLAHAVGNLPLRLHDWNVDFAAWCNYKYMNSGPGAIGGLFVHNRHCNAAAPPTSNGTTSSTLADPDNLNYRTRLTGWWGSQKSSRFAMDNVFTPIPGASGFQLSNPSALDLSSVLASLSVFAKTDMEALRAKSLQLTGYLEKLLSFSILSADGGPTIQPWTIITPTDPAQRGAQLSLRLDEGLLEQVMKVLEDEGVVVDERRPDVIRVAPAPLYNSFEDARRFVEMFHRACVKAVAIREGLAVADKGENIMVNGGKGEKGWSEIK